MTYKLKIFTDCSVFDSETGEFRPAVMAVNGDRILRIITDEELASAADSLPEGDVISLGGSYVIPGLVDVHTHGRGGFDFNTASPEDYDSIALSYAKAGTTAVMPTLASAPVESLDASVKALGEYKNVPGSAAFVGIHLEGRYLSHSKRGAHPEKLLSAPSVEEICRFKDLGGDKRMRLTIAPELEGAEEMIKAATAMGITVSAGHTDANYKQLVEAVKNGVTGFTHTYNCMRPLHHRDPGGAGAALFCDDAYAEFICDGEHICPEMIRLSAWTKDPDHFVLITDSMEAAGCPEGEYSIAGLPVIVKDGRAVNIEGALAGSILDMFTGLVKFMEFTEYPLEEALPFATEIPAKMIGADDEVGALKEGLRADFIVIDDIHAPAIRKIFAGGEEVIR